MRCCGKPLISYEAMALSSVLLPVPLRPTSPYRRPATSCSLAEPSSPPSISGLPVGARRMRPLIATSREPPAALLSR